MTEEVEKEQKQVEKGEKEGKGKGENKEIGKREERKGKRQKKEEIEKEERGGEGKENQKQPSGEVGKENIKIKDKGKKKEKVLVTGGAGYAGSVLVPKLIDEGYDVRVIDIMYFPSGLDAVKDKCEIIDGDITNKKLVEKNLENVNYVIHLAAISNDPCSDLDPELTKKVNYEATKFLVKKAKEKGVKRFIYVSTSSVYGVKEEPNVTEDLPLEPLTIYSKTKVWAEEIVRKANDKDFTTVIIRPATICGYSPRMRLDLTVNILTEHAINKGKITVFGGSQKRPNIHIEDITDYYIALLKAEKEKIAGQTFNAGYENHTVMEIAEIVRKIIGDVEIERTETKDIRSYHISSEKIKRVLGLKPRKTVEDAVLDLKKAFEKGLIPNPENTVYRNIEKMKELKIGILELKPIVIPENYKYIAVFPTMRCNLNCSFCLNAFDKGFNRTKFKEISGKDWVRALNRIKSREDVPITFSGGEPFLHPDFTYIINNLNKELNIDILTNLWDKNLVNKFTSEVKPERLKRKAKYASIRVSYHPEQMDAGKVIENVKLLQNKGFSVGIWAVQYPSPQQLQAITQMQFRCMDENIDFRLKDFTGKYKDELYGDYSKYPESVSSDNLKKVLCKTSDFIVGPDANVYKCHRDLFAEENAIGNLLDADFQLEDKFRECEKYGNCHPCDVKLKTNYKQELGHTSVEIKDVE